MLRSVAIVASVACAASFAMAQGDAQRGKRLFNRCIGCHTTTHNNRAGPGLAGVVGRKAATGEDYDYSKALAASGLTWDEQTLDAFLAAPGKTVPGTKKTTTVADAAERADIIAYLKTLTP